MIPQSHASVRTNAEVLKSQLLSTATGLSKGLATISVLRRRRLGRRVNKDVPIPLRLLGNSLAWRLIFNPPLPFLAVV